MAPEVLTAAGGRPDLRRRVSRSRHRESERSSLLWRRFSTRRWPPPQPTPRVCSPRRPAMAPSGCVSSTPRRASACDSVFSGHPLRQRQRRGLLVRAVLGCYVLGNFQLSRISSISAAGSRSGFRERQISNTWKETSFQTPASCVHSRPSVPPSFCLKRNTTP
jgi:hypothetical protein